jgi:hypothetical protein
MQQSGAFVRHLFTKRNAQMTYGWIIPVLALVTLGLIVVFAITSKAKTDDRKDDPRAPKSSLAKDGPQGGVAMLTPDALPDGQVPAPPAMRP